MKVAMDSDCLIKLAKAGLKERVCESWQVVIPAMVQHETVERTPMLPDAMQIRDNILSGRLLVAAGGADAKQGEDAVLRLYQAGGFDGVATDDARFIRRLRSLGVPYLVPGVVVVTLRETGAFSAEEAENAIASLRPYISSEEYAVAQLMLWKGVVP